MNITEFGYLETPYLSAYPYLSGQIHAGLGMQALMKVGATKITGQQANLHIISEGDDPHVGQQVEMFTDVEKKFGFQVNQRIIDEDDDPHIGMQTEFTFEDVYGYIGQQAEMFIEKEIPTGMQSLMHVIDREKKTGMQVEMIVNTEYHLGMQAKIFPLAHWMCPLYLNVHPYLTTSYLAGCFRAFQGMQVEQNIEKKPITGQQANLHIISEDDDPHTGYQVEMIINKEIPIGQQTLMHIISEADDPHIGQQVELKIRDKLNTTSMQVLMRIVDHEMPTGMQVNMLAAKKSSFQVTMVIYNITQLRILCNFASRGTPALGGANWTSLWPTAAGDFSADNLNTDVIEQRCQTLGLPAIWELRCDTGIAQGAFVDTLAILDHNFSKSARVTFQGTNDPTWGTVGQSLVLVTELTNMYYISPTLPTQSYRYWRFLIEDFTNPDNYLRIGVIVFGSSNIFTLRECFVNPVTYGQKHFKDTIETEGFTNVSNDRALRKFLTLEFQDLKYDGGNFTLLRNYLNHAKTDLKCLIIPRPTRPSALAVFSKLTQLPEESHNAIADNSHYVSLQLSWDESL